jgi:hypothetical protein
MSVTGTMFVSMVRDGKADGSDPIAMGSGGGGGDISSVRTTGVACRLSKGNGDPIRQNT